MRTKNLAVNERSIDKGLNSRSNEIFLPTTLVFCLAALMNLFSQFSPSSNWAVGSLFAFIVFIASLARWAPISLVLLSPLLFLRLTEVLSAAIIEHGAFMPEVNYYGEPTGATARLVAIYILFFSCSALLIESFGRKWKTSNLEIISLPKNVSTLAFLGLEFIVYLAIGYMLVLGFRNGFSLLENVDRFRYARELNNPVYQTILSNRLIAAFLIGFFLAIGKNRLRCGFMICAIFVISVLFSEKFTSISLIIILIVMPAGVKYALANGKIPIVAIASILGTVSLVTMPLVLLVYGVNDNADLAIQKLVYRISSQAGLWFMADKDYQTTQIYFDFVALEADIMSWFNTKQQNATAVGERFGLYYVMKRYADSEILFYAALQGTGFVFSLYSYLLLAYGMFGLLSIGLFVQMAYTVLMIFILWGLLNQRVLHLIVCVKLLILFIGGGFIVGYLWFFFGIKSILFFLVLLPIGYIERAINKQSVRNSVSRRRSL